MTQRLYFTDAYLTEFESTVTACSPANDRFEAFLDQTAFYPTGGGQPHDLGRLGGATVQDVIDREEAGIAHVVDRRLEPGTRVTGVVDWTRRFDHMQQHSGQHMLSAAFEAVCKARTESFHLGVASSTIDLNRLLTATDVAAAEDEVNRIVWQDREVRLRFASAEEAEALPLRKESTRDGVLRLIEVPGFDLSACGGTHVSRTGAVGIVAVTGWEKFKGGTRVEFLCGNRAQTRIREWRDVFSATSRILSVLPSGLPQAIERLQGENKALGRTVRDLQKDLAVHVAAGLVAAGERTSNGHVILVQALDGWDVPGLTAIAVAAAQSPGVRLALFSSAAPSQVVVARSTESSLDATAVVKALASRFDGKGGGKPELAQAGGLKGDVAEMMATVRALLDGRPQQSPTAETPKTA